LLLKLVRCVLSDAIMTKAIVASSGRAFCNNYQTYAELFIVLQLTWVTHYQLQVHVSLYSQFIHLELHHICWGQKPNFLLNAGFSSSSWTTSTIFRCYSSITSFLHSPLLSSTFPVILRGVHDHAGPCGRESIYLLNFHLFIIGNFKPSQTYFI
jgi:hypothetical protein